MNVKLIASQLVILAALIGVYVKLRPEPARQLDTEEAKQTVFSTLPVDRLMKVRITGQLAGEDGEKKPARIELVRKVTELEDKSKVDRWEVASSGGYPAKKDVIEAFIKMVRRIKQGPVQTEDTKLLEKFGLGEKQRTTVEFVGEKDKGLATLVYGKLLPGDDKHPAETFILHRDKVRRAPHTLSTKYLDPKHWLQLKVLDAKQGDLLAFELTNYDQRYRITLVHVGENVLRKMEGKAPRKLKKGEKEKRFWRKQIVDQVTGQVKLVKVNESMVESVVWTLVNDMEAEDVEPPITVPQGQQGVSPQQLARYGLARPVLRLRIQLKEGGGSFYLGVVKSKDAAGKETKKVYCTVEREEIRELKSGSGGIFGKEKSSKVHISWRPVYRLPARVLDALERELKEFDPPKPKKAPEKGPKKGPGKGPKKGPKKGAQKPPADQTIRARIILVGFKGARGSKATRSKTEAMALASRLHMELIGPKKASFADLARKHSEEAASKTSGGDLGFIGRSVRSKAFDAVAFELKKGQISPPVELPTGIALIQRVE